MNRSIVKYTFYSLWKQKSYSLSIFFILFNILSFYYLKKLTDTVVWELLISMNLSAMVLISFFFNVLWSWGEIGQDIKDKRIYILLGRGIKKSEYFISKIFALYLTIFFNALLCLIILAFQYFYFFKGNDISGFFIISLSILLKLFVWNVIICSIFLIFSFFKGFFLSFFIYFYYLILNISDKHDFIFLKKLSYYLMIDQNIYSECVRAFIMQKRVPFEYVFYMISFSLIYSLVIVNISTFFLERKEL